MRPRNIIVALILATAFLWSVRHFWKRHLRTIRDRHYQTLLNSYTAEIKPGMIRSDVENILHQKNVSFVPIQLIGPGLDDLVTIGREDPTGFCTWDDIDVRIHFNSSYDKPDQKGFAWDKVEYVNLLEWPRDCL